MDRFNGLRKISLASAKFRRTLLCILLSGAGLTFFTACYGPASGWQQDLTPVEREDEGDDGQQNTDTEDQKDDDNQNGIVLSEDAPLPGEWK